MQRDVDDVRARLGRSERRPQQLGGRRARQQLYGLLHRRGELGWPAVGGGRDRGHAESLALQRPRGDERVELEEEARDPLLVQPLELRRLEAHSLHAHVQLEDLLPRLLRLPP